MILLLVVSALLAQATAPSRPPAGFVPYQGARPLCSEHVNSAAMHITWQSYVTSDPVEAVVAHYEKAASRKATLRPDGAYNLEWSADHSLSVYPAAKNDAFPHCAVKPAPGERTVVLISTAARR